MTRASAFLAFSFLLACGARSGLDGDGVTPPVPPPIDPSTIGSARPLAPLSTTTTATRTPTLSWSLPKGADGAELELCADRACTQSLAKIQTAGDRVRLAKPLAGHVVFWRVRAMKSGVVSTNASAVWELFTSARDAHDAAWGSVPDFDGDGLADWALGAFGADQESGKVEIFRGQSGGVAQTPSVVLHGETGDFFGGVLGSIGDIDGDGFPELAVGSQSGVSIYAGGPSGIDATKPPVFFGDATPNAIGSAGDLDGDGYGDFFVAPQGSSVVLHFGGAKGSTKSSYISAPVANAFTYVTSGDLDGDGKPDLCTAYSTLADEPRVQVHMGNASAPIELPLESAPVFLAQIDCRGDVDGDGFADVVVAWVGTPNDVIDVFRGGPNGIETTPSKVTFPVQYGTSDSVKGPPIALGDFDGDGRDDLVAGLLGRKLQIVPGSASGLDGDHMRVLPLPGGVPDEYVALALAPNIANGGDVNGDGIVDLVTGAQGYWLGDPPNQVVADVGHAWIYAGGMGGIGESSAPLLELAGPGDDELTFGCDVQ